MAEAYAVDSRRTKRLTVIGAADRLDETCSQQVIANKCCGHTGARQHGRKKVTVALWGKGVRV